MGLHLPSLGNIWDAITGEVGNVAGGVEHALGINQPQSQAPAPTPSVVSQINRAAGFQPLIQSQNMPPPPGFLPPPPAPPPAKPKVKFNPAVQAALNALPFGNEVYNAVSSPEGQRIVNSVAGTVIASVLPQQTAGESDPATLIRQYNEVNPLTGKGGSIAPAPGTVGTEASPLDVAKQGVLDRLFIGKGGSAVNAARGAVLTGNTVQQAAQLPQTIDTLQHGTDDEKTQAAVNLALAVASGAGGASLLHGAASDALKPSNAVKLAGVRVAESAPPPSVEAPKATAEAPAGSVVKAVDTSTTSTQGAAQALDTSLDRYAPVRRGTETMSPETLKATQEAIAARQGTPAPYPGFKEPENMRDVRQNAFAAGQMVSSKAEIVARQADRLFGKKRDPERVFRVFDSIEHPEALSDNASALGIHPDDLQNFINDFKATTDFEHSIGSATGNPTDYRGQYGLHPWDSSSVAAHEALADLAKASPFRGSAAHARVFPDLRTGLAAQYTDEAGNMQNFQLKNLSVGDAIRDWGRQRQLANQTNALISGIQKVAPREITAASEGYLPRDAKGNAYKLAETPGMDGMYVSPRIHRQIQGFRQVDTDALGRGWGVVLRGVDKISRVGKFGELFGGGFHALNTTLRAGGEQMLNAILHPTGIGRDAKMVYQVRRSFWDPKFHDQVVTQLDKEGWTELAAKTGLTGSQGADLRVMEALRGGKLEHLNPYTKALFERRLNLLKLNNLKAEAQRLGIADPRTATAIQIERLSGTADALNARYGGLNLKTINRNPVIQWLVRQGALAPDWWEGKIRTLQYSLDPRQSKLVNKALPDRLQGNQVRIRGAASTAQRQVIGSAILVAVLAELGRKAVTGNFSSSPGAALQNDLLDPNIPLPYTNSKGEHLIVGLPGTDIPEVTRAISDPTHYLQARLAFAPSAGVAAASGTDFYGNPLSDNPSVVNNIVGALKSRGPIPLEQGLKQGQGTQSAATSVINTVGGRVKTDPNDPQAQANKQYFNTLKQVTTDLKNGPYGNFWAQQFANLHPANTTDASGVKYPVPYHPLTSEQKYGAYIDSSSGTAQLSPVFYADQKLANMTPGYPSSPLYKLDGTGLDATGNQASKPLIALEYQHAQTPGQKIDLMDANGGQNGWLAKYETQLGKFAQNYQQNLTDYFKGLGWTDQAVSDYWTKHPSTPDPVDQVTFDQPTTDLIGQYYQMTAVGDTTAAAKFFSDHADVLGKAFDLMAQHANAIRTAKGELNLQGFPKEPANVKQILSSMPQGSDKVSKKARAVIINGNPDVNQYLANVALYENLSKGAQFLYKNPANMNATEGENINAGGAAGQSFLKSTASLGQYDIGSNPTTGQYSFLRGGALPTGSQSAAGRASASFKSKKGKVSRQITMKVHGLRTKRPHFNPRALPPRPYPTVRQTKTRKPKVSLKAV